MIDIIFAVLMVMAVFKGLKKGFIIAFFSVIAFILGLAAAIKLSATMATYLQNSVSISGKWLPFVSFAIVFLVVVLLVNIGGKLLQKTFEFAMLGWLNRLGGIILYIILYLIIYSIFLFYTQKIHLFSAATIQASKTYEYLLPWGPKVMEQLGKFIPIFKDMFTQLGDYFQSVSPQTPH